VGIYVLKIHRHLLDQVFVALQEIFQKSSYADKVIERHFKSNKKWGARDRRFFAENVYDLVRWRRLTEALLSYEHSNRNWHHSSPTFTLKEVSIPNLQRLWVTWRRLNGLEIPLWLAELEKSTMTQIELQKLQKKLSRAQRESIPDWLDELGATELRDEWDALLSALNRPAEVYLRTNTLRTSRHQLQKDLQQEGIPTQLPPTPTGFELPLALQLSERKNVFTSPLFKLGHFEVQDAASQMVAALLNPQPGQRIIDACAGAGGKTLHLACLMQNKGKIIAMDIHEWKLNELKTRARRNGVDIVETRTLDSTKVIKRLETSADGLLLDVPCSGLGVLRRNPDAKWKLTLEDIENLRKTQTQILDQYSSTVKVGGRMVYATCSILPSENEKQIDSFLNRPTGAPWELLNKITIRPDREGFDGFFAALLQRKS